MTIQVAYATALPVAEPCLDEAERRRGEALLEPQARLAFEQAHSLVRRLLSRRVPAVDPRAWRFEADARGKPSLAGPHGAAWHVSLSHARQAVAAALASCPVGVDVERHRPCDRTRLAAGLLHASEREWLQAKADPQAAFFRLWTLKEALAKACGRGLTRALADVAWIGLDDARCVATWDGHRWAGFVRDEAGLALAVVVPLDQARDGPCWERLDMPAAAAG